MADVNVPVSVDVTQAHMELAGLEARAARLGLPVGGVPISARLAGRVSLSSNIASQLAMSGALSQTRAAGALPTMLNKEPFTGAGMDALRRSHASAELLQAGIYTAQAHAAANAWTPPPAPQTVAAPPAASYPKNWTPRVTAGGLKAGPLSIGRGGINISAASLLRSVSPAALRLLGVAGAVYGLGAAGSALADSYAEASAEARRDGRDVTGVYRDRVLKSIIDAPKNLGASLIADTGGGIVRGVGAVKALFGETYDVISRQDQEDVGRMLRGERISSEERIDDLSNRLVVGNFAEARARREVAKESALSATKMANALTGLGFPGTTKEYEDFLAPYIEARKTREAGLGLEDRIYDYAEGDKGEGS